MSSARPLHRATLFALIAAVVSAVVLPATAALSCVSALTPSEVALDSFTHNNSLQVSAPPECSWTATSNSDWIRTFSSGTGDGTVWYDVDDNIGEARTGTITVDDVVFSVSQGTSLRTLNMTSTGPGAVRSTSPEGIACGTACSARWATGTAVSLSAEPDPGKYFVGWTGACAGSNPLCNFSMAGDTNVGAGFTSVYAFSPDAAVTDFAGGAGWFSVSSTLPWTAVTDDPWIIIDSASGGGYGSVTYHVLPYDGLFARVGRITVDGRPFVVTQHGNSSTNGWTWRNPRPRANTFADVTYGAGQFVAVGCVGSIITSPDGIAWTNRTVGNYAYFFNAVTRGPDMFVAVGVSSSDLSVVVLTSPDGVVWTRRPFPQQASPTELADIAWGGGIYVAFADRGMGIGSGQTRGLFTWDGTTWTKTYSLEGQSSNFSSKSGAIAWGNGTFVVVDGSDILTSPDGSSWTKHQGHPGLRSVVWAGSRFLAVGSSGNIEVSTNGLDWTAQITTGITGSLDAVSWGAGRFVALGSGGTWTSTDGIAWNSTTTPTSSLGMIGNVSYGADRFVACGMIFIAASEPDPVTGLRWTQAITGFQGTILDIALGKVAGTPLYIAVGDTQRNYGTSTGQAAILSSTDAISWSALPSPGPYGALSSVVWGNDTFVAAGGGTVLRSHNGQAWTSAGVSAKGVAFIDGMFWAVGSESSIKRSSDATTWTESSAGGTANLLGIARGNGLYVAVGDRVLVSEDGESWTEHPSPASTGTLGGVVFGNGVFVAWDQQPYDYYSIGLWRSTDGVSWTRTGPAANSPMTGVTFGGGVFATVYRQGMPSLMLTSADALTWTLQNFQTPCPGLGISKVASQGNSFFVLGDMGSIIQSATDLGEALDLPSQAWTQSGVGRWYVNYDPAYIGGDAARTDSLEPNQTASISTEVTGPATISFRWKIASNNGTLNCQVANYVNQSIYGTTDWQYRSISIPSGRHTIIWTYFTGPGPNAAGSAWLDAVFIPRYLQVNISGQGTVSDGRYFSCRTPGCRPLFLQGTEVTLRPQPDQGWLFSGWTGACAGTGACTITMDADKSVGATFEVVDATPPTGTISIDGGAAYATGTVVMLTLFAEDASGVTQMQFSDDGASWSAPEPYATGKSWSLTSGDGTKTVYVRFQDAAGGSWSDPLAISDTIILDTTAPEVAIGAPSAATTKTGPVTYLVTYTDTNFDASTLAIGNITLNKTGTANGTVGVTGAGNTRTVTISGTTGDGTLSISLAAGTATDLAGNSAAAIGPSTTFRVDNLPPTVTIIASIKMATEAGPTSGQWTVSRAGSLSEALTVNYAIGGTAAPSDYLALSGSVIIPAGSPTATITVTPVNDTLVEGDETVVATLSADPAYVVGTPASASITILSDDGLFNPTLGGVTPAALTSAPAAAQTFSAVYSDADGYANLKHAYLLANTRAAGANGMSLVYDRTVKKLYLFNDAGTETVGSCTPGVAGSLSNAQGTLNCAATTVSGSGNDLTIKWNITPSAAFASAATRNLYLYARDMSNATAGWMDKGDWTVKPTNVAPTLGGVTPTALTSAPAAAQTFSAVYSDADGYANLKNAYALVNTTAAGANGIYLVHDRTTNKLYLFNDAGTETVGSCTPGVAGSLSNTQGTLNCAATTVSGSGNDLTIKWNITPSAVFASAATRNLYLYARDLSNATAGWMDKGDWTIKPTNVAPTLGNVTPAALTSAPAAAQTFSAVYSDADGYANLKNAYLLVNTTVAGANGIYLVHERTTNRLYLFNDAGTETVGSCIPGVAGSLSNTQGTLNCAATTVSGSGNDLTIKWNITPSAAFASAATRNLYLYARDLSNATVGWMDKGDWTIKPTNVAPALGNVTPAGPTSAPAAAQTFSAVYSDPDGYTNLKNAYLLVNTTAIGANGIYLVHDRTTNKLYLFNDAGTETVGSCTPGMAGSLSNTQGTLDCAATTVSGSGNDLTITWNITPSAAFASATARNLFLYARDMSNATAGWMDKGDWTILYSVQ